MFPRPQSSYPAVWLSGEVCLAVAFFIFFFFDVWAAKTKVQTCLSVMNARLWKKVSTEYCYARGSEAGHRRTGQDWIRG